MIPLKHKFDGTVLGVKKTLGNNYPGYAYTIQAIHYSSNNPQSHLHIFDADGDECMFPVPGDLTPKVLAVSHITVKLPISILDETSGNSITIFGTVDRSGVASNRASVL